MKHLLTSRQTCFFKKKNVVFVPSRIGFLMFLFFPELAFWVFFFLPELDLLPSQIVFCSFPNWLFDVFFPSRIGFFGGGILPELAFGVFFCLPELVFP
jgi:hypothetical protein